MSNLSTQNHKLQEGKVQEQSDEMEVPLTNERKITFGKPLDIQTQFIRRVDSEILKNQVQIQAQEIISSNRHSINSINFSQLAVSNQSKSIETHKSKKKQSNIHSQPQKQIYIKHQKDFQKQLTLKNSLLATQESLPLKSKEKQKQRIQKMMHKLHQKKNDLIEIKSRVHQTITLAKNLINFIRNDDFFLQGPNKIVSQLPQKSLTNFKCTFKEIIHQKTQNCKRLTQKLPVLLRQPFLKNSQLFLLSKKIGKYSTNHSKESQSTYFIKKAIQKNQEESEINIQPSNNRYLCKIFGQKPQRKSKQKIRYIFYRRMLENSKQNLFESSLLLKIEKNTLSKDGQGLTEEQSQQSKDIDEYLKRVKIQNRYRNEQKMAKGWKKIYEGTKDIENTFQDRENEEPLMHQARIIQKIKLIREMDIKFRSNVSVKMRNIKFKTQYFKL